MPKTPTNPNVSGKFFDLVDSPPRDKIPGKRHSLAEDLEDLEKKIVDLQAKKLKLETDYIPVVTTVVESITSKKLDWDILYDLILKEIEVSKDRNVC